MASRRPEAAVHIRRIARRRHPTARAHRVATTAPLNYPWPPHPASRVRDWQRKWERRSAARCGQMRSGAAYTGRLQITAAMHGSTDFAGSCADDADRDVLCRAGLGHWLGAGSIRRLRLWPQREGHRFVARDWGAVRWCTAPQVLRPGSMVLGRGVGEGAAEDVEVPEVGRAVGQRGGCGDRGPVDQRLPVGVHGGAVGGIACVHPDHGPVGT
jgi:hypothetical protein